MSRGHEFDRAFREDHLRRDVGEDRLGEAPQRRDAFLQRGREVEFAAHRAIGDRRDLRERTRPRGQQLDDLLLDECRIDVKDEETTLAHAVITVPLATTVRPDSVTVKPRAMSASRSMPTRAFSSTMTLLSKMAR